LRLLAGGEGENLTVTRSSPQAALHIDVEGARLQVPTDPQVELLAQRAAQPGAVLPAGEEHFVKWLEGSSPQEIERDRIARVRSNRDLVTRPGWTLDLAVVVDGEPVGLQSVSGFDRWPTRRIVGTTSWLLRSHQGRGLGTRCRAAVLELSFAHLGAESAKSWVLADNHASVTVSTKLGYRHTSTDQLEEHGRVLTEHVYQLDAGDWLNSAARRNVAPVVTGAGGLVTLLST
jgi:RimJ/RimL family protein N-acetyltransferase